MKNFKLGLISGLFTFIVWGIMPLIFKFVSNINSNIVLSTRIVISMIILIFYFSFFSSFKRFKVYLRDKSLIIRLIIAGFILTINWSVLIVGVNSNKVLEIVLGFLIAPVIVIILGSIIYKEKISLNAFIAIILVSIGVLIKFFESSNFPYIAIYIAFSFAIYTILKKGVKIPAIMGMFIELFVVSIISLIYLLNQKFTFGFNASSFWLFIIGFLTILTLVTFALSASNLSSVTIGILQFINPLLSTILSITLLNEHLSRNSLISFIFIWAGLIIYSITNLILHKKTS